MILIADDLHLFQGVRDVLVADVRFQDKVDEVHCDGVSAPLTNIYPMEMADEEWADWVGSASEGSVPDPLPMSYVMIESRSAEWIAQIGALLAKGLATPAWFVDTADVAWPVGRVDPLRIRLS